MWIMESSCFFLVLLGITFSAAALTKCPDADKISPCTCEVDDESEHADILLSCKDAEIYQLESALKAIDKTSNLALYLEDMTLGPMASDFFAGHNIIVLDIRSCYLTSLNKEGGKVLSGLEDSLKVLRIHHSLNEHRGKTKLELSHLNKLIELDLFFNEISELSNDWFASGPSSLKTLSIDGEFMLKVDDKVFANLPNLEYLLLEWHHFGPMKRSMLPNPASKLHTLALNNNHFTSIPEDLFTNMPALKTLSLRGNRITKIEERTFKPIWTQLYAIDLEGNPLECDSHIDWVKKTPTSAKVYGKCAGPSHMKDIKLKDFVAS